MKMNLKEIIKGKIAIYLRKSRGESNDDLSKHKLMLIEFCEKYGLEYDKPFEEIGSSDSIDLREEFCKLLKLVENGIYEAVLIADIDRLGRGKGGDRDRITEIFKYSDTLIITPYAIYDLNNEVDEQMVEIQGLMGRLEYKTITRRMRRGKRMGAKQGQWTNGRPPFPYEYQRYKDKYLEKGLVINDDKYTIYREMIDRAVKGETAESIAIDLNKRGLLTAKGNHWSLNTVQRLLVDETHLGFIISNKTKGEGHIKKQTKFNKIQSLPKDEWIIVKGSHIPVKTQDEHDTIIANINARQKFPKKAMAQKHALTGLLKCSICGRSHTFYRLQEDTYIKPCYYKDKLGNKCPNGGTFNKPIEDAILQTILRYKDKCLEQVNFQDTTNIESIAKKIKNCGEAIKKYHRNIESVNDIYESGDYTRDEWLKRKEKWNKLIDETNTEIVELKRQLDISKRTNPENRFENLSNFLDEITLIDDNKTRNDLYRSIIESIEYTNTDEKVQLKINFK